LIAGKVFKSLGMEQQFKNKKKVLKPPEENKWILTCKAAFRKKRESF
jgi:hypothetical protein